MDKNTFQILKRNDIREVEWNILSKKSENWRKEDDLAYTVSFAALACLLKEVDSEKALVSLIRKLIKDETTYNYLTKLASDSFEQIQSLSIKYDIDILKATALFTESPRFTETDSNSTPDGISKLAIALLQIEVDDIVLDLGSGLNSFLIQTGLFASPKHLYGVEINTQCVIIANVRSLVAGLTIQITQGNIISQSFSELQANKVFSNHPLGMRWPSIQEYVQQNSELHKYFKDAKRTISGDWIYNLSALINQKEAGKTIVLMTNAGTWNKPDEDIRKKLVEEGIVEGVILLPAKLFSSTMIPLTMMIFSKGNKDVQMVDASEFYTEGRRQNTLEDVDIEKIINAYYNKTEISRKVSILDVSSQEYILNPQRYVQIDPAINDGISLGEICLSINRGAMTTSSQLDELASIEDTDYHYLMLQNIQDGVVDKKLPSLSHIEEKYLKYCIRDKSLIISKISPFKVAMAHVPDGKTILANGNLYFIELDEAKTNSVFVEFFMQSEAGMAQLNRLAKGSAMKSISIQDLKTIKIPNLAREEQDRIAEKYETLCEELIVLQKQTEIIKDKKARLIEEVI